MLQIRNGLIALLWMNIMLGGTIAPVTAAPAESKVSQCKRYHQAIDNFRNHYLGRPWITEEMRKQNPNKAMNQWLRTFDPSFKQFQARKFSDPKIRGFQQKNLVILIQLRKDMINFFKTGDQEDGAQLLAKAIGRSYELHEQTLAYCPLTPRIPSKTTKQ